MAAHGSHVDGGFETEDRKDTERVATCVWSGNRVW